MHSPRARCTSQVVPPAPAGSQLADICLRGPSLCLIPPPSAPPRPTRPLLGAVRSGVLNNSTWEVSLRKCRVINFITKRLPSSPACLDTSQPVPRRGHSARGRAQAGRGWGPRGVARSPRPVCERVCGWVPRPLLSFRTPRHLWEGREWSSSSPWRGALTPPGRVRALS